LKKLHDIIKNKKTTIITTEESLEDIEPFDWSEEVINGDRKVEIKDIDILD
jgi:hypothetical protein